MTSPVCVPARWLCIGDTILTAEERRCKVTHHAVKGDEVELRLLRMDTYRPVEGRVFRVPATCCFNRVAA